MQQITVYPKYIHKYTYIYEHSWSGVHTRFWKNVKQAIVCMWFQNYSTTSLITSSYSRDHSPFILKILESVLSFTPPSLSAVLWVCAVGIVPESCPSPSVAALSSARCAVLETCQPHCVGTAGSDGKRCVWPYSLSNVNWTVHIFLMYSGLSTCNNKKS